MDLGGAGRGPWRVRLGVAALVAVIAGAVGLSLYALVAPTPTSLPAEIHFQCGRCGGTFIRTREQLSADAAGADPAQAENRWGLLDCPLCKRKRCSGAMVRCPRCGEYFLPFAWSRPPRDADAPVPGEPTDVCPHCKTDRVQWYRENP